MKLLARTVASILGQLATSELPKYPHLEGRFGLFGYEKIRNDMTRRHLE